MTPKQLRELSEDDLDVLNTSYRLYERRWLESLSDLIGSLTGTLWSVDSLTEISNPDLEDVGFTWKKKPERQRISLPLTLVVGGNKVLEHVKQIAEDMKRKGRQDPSVISRPATSFLENSEIVDLSKVSKEEFLHIAKKIR